MPFIYKYKKLYDEATMELDEYTLDILVNNRIYFSKPSEFNDPYDFLLELDMSKNNISDFKNALSAMTESDAESLLVNEFRDNYAVFCATKSHKNMLMWSHYGDNHKGICICMKTYSDPSIEKESLYVKSEQFKKIENRSKYTYYPFSPVDYSQSRAPKFDVAKYMAIGGVPEFMLAKSDVWSYEDELRAVMVISNTDCQTITLEDNQIVEIFFGSKVPKLIKNKLIDRLEGTSIIFNEMQLSLGSYNLKTIEIITKLDANALKKQRSMNIC